MVSCLCPHRSEVYGTPHCACLQLMRRRHVFEASLFGSLLREEHCEHANRLALSYRIDRVTMANACADGDSVAKSVSHSINQRESTVHRGLRQFAGDAVPVLPVTGPM